MISHGVRTGIVYRNWDILIRDSCMGKKRACVIINSVFMEPSVIMNDITL